MTTDYKKVFLDTNVLIYQTFEDFDKEKNEEACNMLKYLTENEYTIYISSQVLRNFLRLLRMKNFLRGH